MSRELICVRTTLESKNARRRCAPEESVRERRTEHDNRVSHGGGVEESGSRYASSEYASGRRDRRAVDLSAVRSSREALRAHLRMTTSTRGISCSPPKHTRGHCRHRSTHSKVLHSVQEGSCKALRHHHPTVRTKEVAKVCTCSYCVQQVCQYG